jgi:hypothetical protein
MRVPIDVSKLTLIAGGPGSPVVKDRSTGELATDPVTNKTWFSVNVIVFAEGDDQPQVWKVKVAGEPQGLAQGVAVKVTGLVANYWEMNERHGLAFRAESITSTGAVKAAA